MSEPAAARGASPCGAPAPPAPSRATPAVVLALFAISGATGLVYEVLWTRALGLVFGHTVFAVTTVLAAFMLGLSLGSALMGRLARGAGDPLRLYAALEAGIGLTALVVPVLISTVAPLAPALVGADASPLALSGAQFGLILPILLVPTALMGGTLPVLVRLTGEGTERLGVRAATLYAANTFGAVAGVAAAGFLLLPALGNRKVHVGVASPQDAGLDRDTVVQHPGRQTQRRQHERNPADEVPARLAIRGTRIRRRIVHHRGDAPVAQCVQQAEPCARQGVLEV